MDGGIAVRGFFRTLYDLQDPTWMELAPPTVARVNRAGGVPPAML
jgi:hypothetical protein